MQRQLDQLQQQLLERARRRRDESTRDVDDWAAFQSEIERGGFLRARLCGDDACEDAIKESTKATVRCLPFGAPADPGACVRCGQPASRRAWVARAY